MKGDHSVLFFFHFRFAFVVRVSEHWDERFSNSALLSTALRTRVFEGAALHTLALG